MSPSVDAHTPHSDRARPCGGTLRCRTVAATVRPLRPVTRNKESPGRTPSGRYLGGHRHDIRRFAIQAPGRREDTAQRGNAVSHEGVVSAMGDFTMLKYIATLGPDELERAVGYEPGRLKSGFWIVVLAGSESLSAEDFELRASSRYPGGAVRRTAPGANGNFEEVLASRGQDVAQLKRKVARFFARRGGNTPAKVLPNLRHTEGMLYPAAEALGPGIPCGVPQFTLLTPKRFVIVRAEK